MQIKSRLIYESSFDFFLLENGYYPLLKKSLTCSGAMIDSTKVYAPVLGDLTILMAFVSLLEPVCKDATAFFAMILQFN